MGKPRPPHPHTNTCLKNLHPKQWCSGEHCDVVPLHVMQPDGPGIVIAVAQTPEIQELAQFQKQSHPKQ
eukprot:5596596-Amphidinium_carterae.1